MAKITYIQPDGTPVTVTGEPGMTVMETAKKHLVQGIEAECGGACACATCHVYVAENWLAALVPPIDEELERLDDAFEVTSLSRLSCQILMRPDLDGLVVTLAPGSEP